MIVSHVVVYELAVLRDFRPGFGLAQIAPLPTLQQLLEPHLPQPLLNFRPVHRSSSLQRF
jgi:hypothetical protein